jgi:hypothetical protein
MKKALHKRAFFIGFKPYQLSLIFTSFVALRSMPERSKKVKAKQPKKPFC